MNRIAIKINNKKIDLSPVEKKRAETEKIPHLTIFNMILTEKNTVVLFRISKECDFKGFWTFVAGHIETMEEVKKPVLSAIRETEEEIGIKLNENEFYILGKTELKKANKYKITEEDLLKESEISKNLGLNMEPPHLILPFVSFLKKTDRIILGNELDKFEKVKINDLNGHKMTPITKAMIERFLSLSNSNII